MAGGASPEAVTEDASLGRTSLSVVVPTWNEREHLPRLLGSLGLGDDGPDTAERPDEVIVADGGSDDGTPELAAALGARVVRTERGRGTQLARGAAAARGELLWFLHADVVVAQGSLHALRRAFEDPRLFACGVRQEVDAAARVYRWIERAANLRVRLGRVYGDSGLAVRRAVYEAVGGFRDLPLFEDLDLSRRLRVHGRIGFVPEAVTRISARRWRAEGAVTRTVKNWALTGAFALGVAPERLERYYRPQAREHDRS